MVTAKFIYRKSDNVFIGGGFYDAQPPTVVGPPDVDGNPTSWSNYVEYGVAEFGDADLPDLKRHRFDPATGGKRLATAQELAAADDATVTQQAELTSRQKDILTTVAYIVRRTNVAAWNAMSNADKKTAVMAQADIWRDLRVLVEKL